MNQTTTGLWGERADRAQQALDQQFWNESILMYDIQTPCKNGDCNDIFHYWWMAHAVDTLVDGLVRTGEDRYTRRLEQLYDGLLQRNGGVWPNELYDDMEWMALAWLRAYQATSEPRYLQAVRVLWEDIQTGWNEAMGGGIAWQKSQLDYKNTPANAPAVILAARLYRSFGNEEDLAWAQKIYDWQRTYLVDPDTGFVWDGMNRTGDGTIDKDWEFTYCQGVFIGASVELYRISGQPSYLEEAMRTFRMVKSRLVQPASGLLPDEGNGDAGLFKGILMRYVAELSLEVTEYPEVPQFLAAQAEGVWTVQADSELPLFGTEWAKRPLPADTVQLSSQLSGTMLLEMMAAIHSRD